ncbi:MAG: 5-(carboxyamino)imidazole ribonucleotide synthase [Methylacidiphilales bacterium]|nr:5-(carboxyamino)imidazole ribonucleotide synthase [Candidatus Methylacidiphilales bacterium]MDW8349498.1 5-(carboxyamino)imidazole ribonucleotide synthase [Verrucomicrobiae bacterium]
MRKPILPGATLGLIGGGQLGRMFALQARRMGYRVHTFDPSLDSPSGQISDREFIAPFDDEEVLREFAESVDCITYEFENIPLSTLQYVQKLRPCYPDPRILYIAQNREREKNFLSSSGFPTVNYRIVESEEALRAAVKEIGLPAVLKTCDFGYDGKGQQKITRDSDLARIWRQHGTSRGIVEAWVENVIEFSTVITRVPHEPVAIFPITRNRHSRHILDLSVYPSGLPSRIEEEARLMARELAQKLDLIGLITVEFFLTPRDDILINEIAPRPHNSGHYTFDACVTSQFEQQLRAVCGLPLGSTQALCAAAIMTNLLGDLWLKGSSPNWIDVLKIPGLKLHLYGKTEARPGRKMGHYTILGDSLSEVMRRDVEVRQLLGIGTGEV